MRCLASFLIIIPGRNCNNWVSVKLKLKINESRYTALFVVSESIKNFFSVHYVSIYFFSVIFFQQILPGGKV